MSDSRGPLGWVSAVLAFPVRPLRRVLGYLVALVLLLLVPVATMTACSLLWSLPFLAAETAVGLPVVGPVGLVRALGLPPTVAGVPTLYPIVTGVPTALVLGWPDPDHGSDLGSGIFRRV